MAYKKRKFVKKGKFVKKAKKIYKKKGSSFAAKVKKVLFKAAEHKNVTYQSSTTLGNYAGGASLTQFRLTPSSGQMNIQQGVGQGDRIGNKVKVVKATLSYVIVPLPFDVTSNPQPVPYEVRLMIGKNKTDELQAPSLTNIFQFGDSSGAPTGNLLDMIAPFNKDVCSVQKVISHKVGYQQYGGGAGNSSYPTNVQSAQYWSNNDFKMNVKKVVDITKFFPASLQWNDATSTPTWDSVWLTAFLSAADGGVSTSSQPCGMTYVINVVYVDV